MIQDDLPRRLHLSRRLHYLLHSLYVLTICLPSSVHGEEINERKDAELNEG